MEESQRAAAIQVGIQHAASIEYDLSMKASSQTERFKKPNSAFMKKKTWQPQTEEASQVDDDDLEGENEAVDEDETLVNGKSDCDLVQSRW